ncbi:MAG: hypothetical protein IPI21_11775 [Propionivibrio sp.]|nr:hypothetical protein [Propionivibrio sp.]
MTRGGDAISQYAIGSEADTVAFFVGLEVNVRRAVVDGIKQHLLDELYNRSIVDFECRCVVGLFLILVVRDFQFDVLRRSGF